MPATTIITLRCDHYGYGFENEGECQETIETTATLVGKSEAKAKLDTTVPDGWWMGHKHEGYGHGPNKEISCACPKHAKKMRGY